MGWVAIEAVARHARHGDLYAEPASLGEYYAMYGGRPAPYPRTAKNGGKHGEFSYYLGCGDYLASPIPLGRVLHGWYADVTDWMDEAYCRWHGWRARVAASIAAKSRAAVQQFRGPVLATRSQSRPVSAADRSADRSSYGRTTVLGIAGCLDKAAEMLQNASRRLTQMVENRSVEVTTQPGNPGRFSARAKSR
jgi:hypothetical protein